MKRTPIEGEPTFAEFALCGYEYLGTVEFELPRTGAKHVLELRFAGGPTDYLWNSSKARDFYRDLIDKQGGRVTAYGVSGVGPRGDLLVDDDRHSRRATVTL